MRRLHLLFIALLILPLASGAQRFAHDPFYEKTQAADATALHRWDSSANGVIFHMSLTAPHYGPWDEGMKVDGAQSRQVVHWYLQDNHYGVYFGYDLVLEPVAGSSQIKCTFSAFNNPYDRGGRMNGNLPHPTLSDSLTPLLVDSGDTLEIAMLPGPDGKEKFVQYIRVELDTAKSELDTSTPDRVGSGLNGTREKRNTP